MQTSYTKVEPRLYLLNIGQVGLDAKYLIYLRLVCSRAGGKAGRRRRRVRQRARKGQVLGTPNLCEQMLRVTSSACRSMQALAMRAELWGRAHVG